MSSAFSTVQLVEQFARLAQGQPTEARQPLAVIAERLCCGERNARLLLGRMQTLGWLRWTPGRGRGQLSRLTLLQDPGALRAQQLHGLLAEGRIEAAFAGLPADARQRVQAALPGFLGASPGGGLRIPFYRPLHALDPIHVTRRTEANLVGQLCDRLTVYDLDAEAMRPALAHHWEASDDGRLWRLWLRPGLRFQDGRPLRAQDAAASLLRLRDTAGPHRGLMAHLGSATVQGLRLDLQLNAADHLMPNRLAHHACAILPAGDWQRADFATLPIGAGAFRIVRNNEHRATLATFEGYWGVRPLLDQIDLWVVPPGSPMPVVDVKLGGFTTPSSEPGPWRTLQQAEQGCDFVLLNPARTAFAAAAARCEVGHWLRGHVARHGLSERHRVARGWLPAWSHLPKPPTQLQRPPRLPRQLRLVTYELDDHIALAQSVAQACTAAGSTVHLEVLSAPEFAQGRWHTQADIAVSGEVLGDDLAFGQFSALAGDSSLHT
ncbi:ABC transporter substrate-binding protein [Ideonella sp.]|uniref:ABC transporter substrate-binding protein n=1 Tax=Ideonella sp. TaxID=1929293 RepID=UPI003BB80D79